MNSNSRARGRALSFLTPLFLAACGGGSGSPDASDSDARTSPPVDAGRHDAADAGKKHDAAPNDAAKPDAAKPDAKADASADAKADSGRHEAGSHDAGTPDGEVDAAHEAASDAGHDAVADSAPEDAPEAGASDAGTDGPVDAAHEADVAPPPPTYTIGGTVVGLAGSIVLEDNGGDDLPISANGAFTFTTPLLSGQLYGVTTTNPAAPANEQCTVAGGSGPVGSADIDSVVVTCTPNPPDAIPTPVDIAVTVDTSQGRIPISPLLYGVNTNAGDGLPATLLASTSVTRRGGDRGNTYNWETNVSNGGIENGYASDLTLTAGIPDPNAPAGQDLTLITANRAAGRATMVPFVLNGYVAAQVTDYIPYDQPGYVVTDYWNQNFGSKPGPYAATPDLNDGAVYADEHLDYMRHQFADDILAPGPGQVLVGIDNEADLWEYNFPMLQRGSGDTLYSSNNGVAIGNRLLGSEFTSVFLNFATKVKSVAPNATIIGPAHYGYDGFEAWNQLTSSWTPGGNWYMDDFLTAVNAASQTAGVRLLDTWDFHWYPQALFGNTNVFQLDNDASPLTDAEIDAIVQSPRSYWDPTYDEGSYITDQYHLAGPAQILNRLATKIDADYPGTGLAVSEYFPGGRNHIASGLAVVDSLGVFQTYGIALAAMWPFGDNGSLTYAFGGIELVHNADGNGLRYADTAVSITNPDIVSISTYAGMDTPDRVTMLVVNKTQGALNVGLSITNAISLANVDIYRIDAADPSPYLALQDSLSLNNAYVYATPALSASLLVFHTP